MAALLPLVQPIGPLAQLEPRFPSAAHSTAATATAVTAGDYSVIEPNACRVVRPDIQAAASGGCQREGLVEDCRGSSGDSGADRIGSAPACICQWSPRTCCNQCRCRKSSRIPDSEGWPKPTVPIVPAVATPPNCAGMPVTRADTNMPNHIIRDPATDCMK